MGSGRHRHCNASRIRKRTRRAVAVAAVDKTRVVAATTMAILPIVVVGVVTIATITHADANTDAQEDISCSRTLPLPSLRSPHKELSQKPRLRSYAFFKCPRLLSQTAKQHMWDCSSFQVHEA